VDVVGVTNGATSWTDTLGRL